MSKFYVGQRVKVKESSEVAECSRGGTGTITCLRANPIGFCDGFWTYQMVTNVQVEYDTGGGSWGHTDFLEPIQYDGNEKISWEEMKELWMPEGMNV